MNENKGNILESLDLVPAWARQPADTGVQYHPTKNAGERPDRRSDRRGMGRSRDRSMAPGASRRSHNPAHSDADRLRRNAAFGDQKNFEMHPSVSGTYRISFIPERRGLKPLVNQLSRTQKAWPLVEVAKMFLSKPEFYAVKIEVAHPNPGHERREQESTAATLYQCSECREVFQTSDMAVAHALRLHFDQHFETEEKTGEPPKGSFSCVARCGLSGVLLGPPNYHQYNASIQELHRRRYPGMTMEEYRRHIVNETDPDLIEKWRQAAALTTVHRTKEEPEPKVFERRMDAEAFFIDRFVPRLISKGGRFIVPGVVVQNMEDRSLQQVIKNIWLKEHRTPLRIILSVRPAFKQLGMYVFRDETKAAFITSIQPHPLVGAQTTPELNFIFDHLSSNPKTTSEDLVGAWASRPEADQAAASDLAGQLRWLIDKGHVIEFYDGKLMVPTADCLPGNRAKPKS